jgi:hypothetical protein
MAVKPILFSGPMVRALLEGRKTQTRRVLKEPPRGFPIPRLDTSFAPGDLLWVRETWGHDGRDLDEVRRGVESDGPFRGPYYATDADWFDNATIQRKPSIHMPRWASRLTLCVTNVRVQRVQYISGEDVEAEGVVIPDEHRGDLHSPSRWGPDHFRPLWDDLNEKRGYGWDANPWVVALTFTVHRCNVDFLEAR